MRNMSNLNNLFSRDRKLLYIILSIVMFSVLTLTVVYAALSTTLNINGNAEVSAASWDIYLDNIVLNNQSATSNVPTITDKTTASFSTTLNKPGDFYEFTIDVVNNGTIDAMIDSVTKTPELTTTQAKYVNYIVEYQNGESITSKQLVAKKSFVRLKVRVEFRKDIISSDLPTQSEMLDLAFTVNYTQADETGIGVKDDGLFKLGLISGDLSTVGSEVTIGDEHFYIISSDEKSVTMLAKYNLYVGGKYESSSWTAYGNEATGIQNETMLGSVGTQAVSNGTTKFSSTNYWYDGSSLKSEYGTEYPAFVYDSNSILYNYVENYKKYLEKTGAVIEQARLIKMEELEKLGCVYDGWNWSCAKNAPTWVYATSYWTGSAAETKRLWRVYSSGALNRDVASYENNSSLGVRPVITISI